MQKTLQVIRADGAPGDTVELLDTWLETEKGEQAVHDAIVAFLAGQRAGTACTKTRGLVRGGGAKPWRQKGTGRARAGSNRSPVWRGGGTIFGPLPRRYDKQVNAKVRLLALKRAFSERVAEGSVIVVDGLPIAEPKTRHMIGLLKRVGAGDDVLVVVDTASPQLLLASRNLPGIEILKAGVVNPYWLLLFKKILFTRAGFDLFTKRLTGAEKRA